MDSKSTEWKSAGSKRALASLPPPPPEASLPAPELLARKAAARAMAGDPLAPARASPLRSLLAEAEGTADEPCQGYAIRNTRSGALGRYQILPVALRDIGWQDAQGRWTERAAAAGVRSEADFLARPTAQEQAMADYLRRTEQQLSANGAFDKAGRRLTGVDGQPILLTRTGLVAAAHRQGAGAVARWLENRLEKPQAPLSPAQRNLFQSIETRLRNFTSLPGGSEKIA
ncbi:hypothetical protein NON00_18320 [Roseomonas sp. GC11]|uniref:hypothetical protein n=1 Tax=Roseomonas sp. GC11 TaxID=2950546 RepID=UPI002108C31C|nr:hypothetical protein [Roseomonas sp. GC11]MCQ4161873.1 hypothetical protein [Roseomonas sp. GC11]